VRANKLECIIIIINELPIKRVPNHEEFVAVIIDIAVLYNGDSVEI
jgi:hypothetical protein